MPLFKFQIYATPRCVSDSPMYPTMPRHHGYMMITPMCPHDTMRYPVMSSMSYALFA